MALATDLLLEADRARAAGAHPIGGLAMLIHQGAESFRLWTGLEPPIDVMFEAARTALAERAQAGPIRFRTEPPISRIAIRSQALGLLRTGARAAAILNVAALTREPAITAVVGQHVHVVQPIRRVNRRIVVFGEGNLLSNQTPACCAPGSQDGLLALLRIRVVGHRARLQHVDYVPVWDRHPDFTIMPVGLALRRGWSPRSELRASLHRTMGVVGHTTLYAPWSRAKP